MGAWTDSGDIVWLPHSLYPKRQAAIMWAMEQWDCNFIQVRCRSRSMRYEPDAAEDQWSECEENTPGAFRVWRLEGA